MTDKKQVLKEINEVLDYPWNKNYESSQIRYILHNIPSCNFYLEQIDTGDDSYCIVSYCSKKIGHTIIIDNDVFPAWDSAEDFADWIVKTNAEIQALEDQLPDLKGVKGA